MQQEEKRKEIQEERDGLSKQFDQTTIEWMELDPQSEEAKLKASMRLDLAKRLRENYWRIDPHIRARTYYHRAGVVGPDGEVNFQAAT